MRKCIFRIKIIKISYKMWHTLNERIITKVTEEEWQNWYIRNVHNLTIARDKIRGVIVSTVFVGIPLNFKLGEESSFFQTKILGGKLDGKVIAAPSFDEAISCHLQFCSEVIEAL